jgi:CrcB protein
MPSESFPYGTMTVNLVGSVLLGVLTAAVAVNTLSETQALLFGTGLLGAFTTMSTFSIETATLWDEQRWSALLCYVSVTALGGPLLALLSWKTTASVMA